MNALFPLWPNGIPTPDGINPPSEIPQFQLFAAETQTPTGMVLVCPGGGYGGRAPHEAEPVARMFNMAGITAGVVSYRVAPHRYPVPQLDAMRAIRMARANAEAWNIKADKVAILGFSAGGHLAASTATLGDHGEAASPDPVSRFSGRPDAAILCYPVISSGEWGHRGSMHNLLGPTPDPIALDRMSLEKRVDTLTPPTFLWHTANDPAVPVQNSLLFAQALSIHRIPYELHVFPSGPHGMGLAEADPIVGQWPVLCVKWLKSMGW